MKVIVVDDEQAARGWLCDLLRRIPGVTVVDQAANGIEAIEKVNAQKPDLLFLDVRMPVLSGFDILPYLEDMPLIVFCTAYDEYAVRAFEANALDYLLKPVEFDRLERCFRKLRERRDSLARLSDLPETGLQKIVCRTQRSRHVVWLEEILLFQKEGRYTTVLTTGGSAHLTDLTVDYLHEHLHTGFFRINRGEIVARTHVRSLQTQSSGNGQLVTRDGKSLTVSRGRMPAFRAWLEET